MLLSIMVDIIEETEELPSPFSSSLVLPYPNRGLEGARQVIGRKYKSGAIFLGSIKGNKRDGNGSFQWPCGVLFEGTYKEGLRHGSGKQFWQDGSHYSGSYNLDSREGYGSLQWANGERFEGQFLNDKKHGKGIYTWSDGTFYEGYFRKDKKWGYGVFCYSDGRKFEGFYRDDIRCGPGILTYTDGKQDVGVWKDEQLLSLCNVFNNAFMSSSATQYSVNSAQQRKNEMTVKPCVIDPLFTPLCESLDMKETELLNQIPQDFNIKDILYGNRSNFGVTGNVESLSEALLKAASQGDAIQVKHILGSRNISANISDNNGHFPLMSASVNCHLDVIDVLLDYGANINKRNVEGVTALTACHVLLYTEDIFISNIAEDMKEENMFNAIEWDAQKGAVSLRNERQLILELYENRIKSSSSASGLKKRPKSRLICVSHASDDKDGVSVAPPVATAVDIVNYGEDINSEEEKESKDHQPHSNYNDWKIDYFKRTIDRLDKLDDINRKFQRFQDNASVLLEQAKASNLQQKGYATKNSSVQETTSSNVTLSNFSHLLCKTESVSTSRQTVYDYAHFEHTKKTLLVKRLEANRKTYINKERKPHLEAAIDLLISRGANPNAAEVPMPVIFYAVKTANVKAVHTLLKQGADPAVHLGSKGLTPLHIAAALPCHKGIDIVKLLLNAGATPNTTDTFFGNEEPGRTPLHLACCREDNYKDSQAIVEILLASGADPNALCRGHSPLTLAISSGNDLAIETLLNYNADPSLPLPGGIGSALCVAVGFSGERRRKANDRLALVERLVRAGADMFTPVLFSERYGVGTVVDYAHYVFIQDRRIAHSPYHALSAPERDCHNSRKALLDHLGLLLRTVVVQRGSETLAPVRESREKLDNTDSFPRSDSSTLSRPSPSSSFSKQRSTVGGKFRYCNECGRSAGVRLTACSRCKEVLFCSKACKLKAWFTRHKEECTRTMGSGARVRSTIPGLPPITKKKKGDYERVNNYWNSEKHCLCDLKQPEC